jgi:hypothetical protein
MMLKRLERRQNVAYWAWVNGWARFYGERLHPMRTKINRSAMLPSRSAHKASTMSRHPMMTIDEGWLGSSLCEPPDSLGTRPSATPVTQLHPIDD